MGKSVREFTNSPWEQGVDERRAYTVDTSLWEGTGSVTGIVVKLYTSGGVDVSATQLTGSGSAVGDIITTPLVISLVLGETYRLEVQWIKSGNTLEGYGFIEAKK